MGEIVDALVEGQLLLYCLRVASGEEPATWFRLFRDEDWAGVVRQAGFHEVGPLLFRLFQEEGVVRPPPAVLARLEEQYRCAAADNERKFQQLGQVLTAFRAAAVPSVVLKGAALAETVYLDRALRTMTDLDVLVRRQDLERAEGVLVRLGFEPLEQYFGDRESFATYHHHLVPYGHRESRVAIEVHWNLVAPAYGCLFDPETLWQRARPAKMAGTEALVPAPEDLLYHLCLHATVLHGLTIKLRDLWDLTLVLRRHGDELDWKGFLNQARQHGLGRCVWFALELARRLLNAPCDRLLIQSLRADPLDECLVELFRNHVLGTPGSNLFPQLWRRREVGPDGWWKDYYDLELGCAPLWGVAEVGFHAQEVENGQPVRWTDGAARLIVPVDPHRPPRKVALRLWIRPEGTRLDVRANGRTLREERASGGDWSRTIRLPKDYEKRTLTLELLSDVAVAEGGGDERDNRRLGVLVREVRLQR